MPSIWQWKWNSDNFSHASYFNFAGSFSHTGRATSHQCPFCPRMKQLLWWLARNCGSVFKSSIFLCLSITLHLVWVLERFNVFPVFHTISQMFSVWQNPKCIFAKLFPLQSVHIAKKIWAICFCFIGCALQNSLW